MSSRSTGRKLDSKAWSAIPGQDQETAVTGTLIVSGGLSFTAPSTILRVRGSLYVGFDETQQAGDRANIVFGLGIVSTDAFTLGPTAVPDPSADPNYSWLWYGEAILEAFVAAGFEGIGASQQRFDIDTKAMRRIRPGETLCLIAQATQMTGAPQTIIRTGQLRTLFGF